MLAISLNAIVSRFSIVGYGIEINDALMKVLGEDASRKCKKTFFFEMNEFKFKVKLN